MTYEPLTFILLAINLSITDCALCVITAIIVAVVVAIVVYTKMRRKVDYMLDALEDKELNFRFNEQVFIGRGFNKTLNRLRTIFDKERREINDQERYYGEMLDHVQTGVMVVDDGMVLYCNRMASLLLGISTISHIRQLNNISPELYNAFRDVSPDNEQRVSFYTERGELRLAVIASETEIHGKSMKIIAFNDISSDMAENEELAWSRLIRVLTHEIMNTVTPIASLSETLSADITSPDLQSGLETIASSSRGLIKFVDTYRTLTRVTTPIKHAFYFREFIERILTLVETQYIASQNKQYIASQTTIKYSYIEKSNDILLYADENQISQIFINLIRNAIQAEATKIDIIAEIEPSDIIRIDVVNNGRPISKESQSQIFIPFFSTKPDGTGIGLSLSRQIMRLHNGSIRLLRSDDKQTVFSLLFK